jgi:hypothetical protein
MTIESSPGGTEEYTVDQLMNSVELFESISVDLASRWQDLYLEGSDGANNSHVTLECISYLFSAEDRRQLPGEIAEEISDYKSFFSILALRAQCNDLQIVDEGLPSDNLRRIKVAICNNLIPEGMKIEIAHLFVWGASIVNKSLPWMWINENFRHECANSLLESQRWLAKLTQND